MGKDKGPQKQSEQKVNSKLEEQRKKAAEGTTKPLPVGKPAVTEEEKKVDEKNAKMAKKISDDLAKKKAEEEAILEEMKATKAKLDALRAKHKAEKNEAKNAKKAEAEKTLAERMKKSKEIEDADAKVVKCDKDRKATEEWKLWEKAVAEREALGSLPKVKKGGVVSGTRTKKAPNGLTGNMIKLLNVMDDGVTYGSGKLAEMTGIAKGKPFPLMEEMGLLEVQIHEGERGKRFLITKKGREELEKALAVEEG